MPIKSDGKKSRLRQDGSASAGDRQPKRAGKGKTKTKVARKSERSEAVGSGQAPATKGVNLPAAAVRAVKALGSPKLGRSPIRMGRLERLEAAIEEVRLGGRASPRTSKLQMAGVPKMAQKVIEEAGEVAIEALQGNRTALVNESVDLLYNMLVLLSAAGVKVEALWAEMDRREIALGMAEKLPKANDLES